MHECTRRTCAEGKLSHVGIGRCASMNGRPAGRADAGFRASKRRETALASREILHHDSLR